MKSVPLRRDEELSVSRPASPLSDTLWTVALGYWGNGLLLFAATLIFKVVVEVELLPPDYLACLFLYGGTTLQAPSHEPGEEQSGLGYFLGDALKRYNLYSMSSLGIRRQHPHLN